MKKIIAIILTTLTGALITCGGNWFIPEIFPIFGSLDGPNSWTLWILWIIEIVVICAFSIHFFNTKFDPVKHKIIVYWILYPIGIIAGVLAAITLVGLWIA